MTLILPEDFLVTEALRALDARPPADFPLMRLKDAKDYVERGLGTP